MMTEKHRPERRLQTAVGLLSTQDQSTKLKLRLVHAQLGHRGHTPLLKKKKKKWCNISGMMLYLWCSASGLRGSRETRWIFFLGVVVNKRPSAEWVSSQACLYCWPDLQQVKLCDTTAACPQLSWTLVCLPQKQHIFPVIAETKYVEICGVFLFVCLFAHSSPVMCLRR